MMGLLLFKEKAALANQISNHLKACDAEFVPRLSQSVDIEQYAQKIFDKAITFEAWEDGTVIGLIAVYYNDLNSKRGFITNVSVLPQYHGKRIAKTLLRSCISYGQKKHYKDIDLEVNKNNKKAIAFYTNNNFAIKNESETSYIMTYSLLNNDHGRKS